MRLHRSRPRRPGMAALDALLTAVVLVVVGASGYALARTHLDAFLFTLGGSVGWPLF